MDNAITDIEKACGREVGSTKMLAAIESPLGITQANQIATASKRLIGIALGAEDYVRNLKTERSPEGIELLFARCSILQAARAAVKQPARNIVFMQPLHNHDNRRIGAVLP